MCCLNARSFPAFLLICCWLPVFSLFHSVKILPRLNFRILHSVILLPRFHVPCFFIYSVFCPMGWEFLVQTYIDSRNLVCDVSTIFRIDSGRKGHTKNLSLEGNCALFVGCILLLNEVALSMLPQICSVECPYSIFVFFLKKSCLDLKSGTVMAQWRETVTWRRWKRFITGLQASLFQHFCEMLHT